MWNRAAVVPIVTPNAEVVVTHGVWSTDIAASSRRALLLISRSIRLFHLKVVYLRQLPDFVLLQGGPDITYDFCEAGRRWHFELAHADVSSVDSICIRKISSQRRY